MDHGMIDEMFFEYFNLLLVYNGRLNISKLKTFPSTYMLGWTASIEDEDIIDLIFALSPS